MFNNCCNTFQKILPPELMEKAISLTSTGVNELAWKWQDAITVVEILVGNGFLVLGGDVYFYSHGKFKATRDNWCFQSAKSEGFKDAINKSRDHSVEYIKTYAQKNGENFYYSIVVRE